MASTRNWTLEGILNQGPNFQAVHRVSAMSNTLSQTIQDYESRGIPLVIEDFHKDPRWPQHMFTLNEFIAGTSPDIHVRNIHDWRDSTLPVDEFIAKCRLSSVYRVPDETVRFYGKDAECPKVWETWLQNGGVVPEILLCRGKEDLFHCRPDKPEAAIETLMCYLGIGDTFTPCHKDLCASSGQNLMCYTERDGSSFWFMTESSSAPAAAEYFRERLGQELDNENHIVTIEELTKAPFRVFVLQQRLGDMVLVPPRSCHQVMNSGGITVKTSWSRMTLKGLSTAYYYELPIYRRVCRPETYRVKSTIHHALVSLTNKLENSLNGEASKTGPNQLGSGNCAPLVDDLKVLLSLYDRILVEEYEDDSAIRKQLMYKSDTFNDDIRLVCDFCSGDIFQSFFECRECCDVDDDPCQLCPGCYVEGRNCKCGDMQPMQYQDFQRLIDVRTKSVNIINAHEMRHNRSYQQPLALGELQADLAALFQAACILYRSRRDLNPKRTAKICRAKEQSHETKPLWLLHCKKCHNARCFSHLLTQCNMHSAEALLFYSSDASHDEYHRHHLDVKKYFEKEINALRDDRKRGIPPRSSAYRLLVENATKYRYSRPKNSEYMESGWYDAPLHRVAVATVEKAPISLLPSSGLLSSQATTDGTISSVGTTSNDSARGVETLSSTSQTSKKRRRVFVDVPQAPYDIRRALFGVAHGHLNSSLARSSHKEECLPHPTVRETATRTDAWMSNASRNVPSREGKKAGYAGSGLPNKPLAAVIDKLAKPGKRPGDHQLLSKSNEKFGPPFGVARASKLSHLPKDTHKEQSMADIKATVVHDVLPDQANNALQTIDGLASPPMVSYTPTPFPSTLSAQGGQGIHDAMLVTSQGRLSQVYELQIPSQHHPHSRNPSTHGTIYLPSAIESYVDSGQDVFKKRKTSESPQSLHVEEIINKKKKVEHQPSDGEADRPDTLTQLNAIKLESTIKRGPSSHFENGANKDMKKEFEVNGASANVKQAWNGHEPQWHRAYYSTVSDIQVESPPLPTQWASKGTAALDTSQMTLASLQLQGDSSTSINLGKRRVNAATTKDGNVMDELSLVENITHSTDTAPHSPLLTNPANYSIFPDNEGSDKIWGQAMLSPSSMFEVIDINFE